MIIFTAITAIATAVLTAAGMTVATMTLAGAVLFYGTQAILYLGLAKLISNRLGRVGNGVQDIGARIQLPPATDNKLPVVYGTAWISPVIVDAEISADNKTMWYVCALAEVTDTTAGSQYNFGDIYYDGKLVTFDSIDPTKVVSLTTNSNPVQTDTKINGYLYLYFYRNGSTGATSGVNTSLNAYDVIPKWDSTYTMDKAAFVIAKVVYNTDAGTTGLSTIQTQIINTLDKPGSVIKDYLQNTRYGCGVPLSRIDTASLAALDTYSDQLITYVPVGGGTATQARYRINGPINTGTTCLDNLQYLVDSCDSWLQYSELTGLWRVVINQSYTNYTTLGQLYHLTDDNIIGGLNINPIDLNESYNQVELQYPNTNIRDQTDTQLLKLSTIAPEVMSPNEALNKLIIQLPLVNNAVQAKYLGVRRLLQGREDLAITVQTDYSGIQVTAGDVIRVTYSKYGWTEKLFRVSTVGEEKYPDSTLGARIQAFEYNNTIYNDNAIQDFVPEENTGVADPNILSAPTTPVVATTPLANGAIASFTVAANVPSTGTVLFMDYNYGLDSNVANHQLYTTVAPSIGEQFAASTPTQITVADLPTNTYYWSATARNKLAGVISSNSTPYSWVGPSVTQYDAGNNIGGITNLNIAANTITANKLSVTDLSAITANMGTLTSGNILTAPSGVRMEMSSYGNFVLWYGVGDKDEANGIFYIKTDGTVFMNGIINAQPGSSVPSTGGNLTVTIGTVVGSAQGFPLSGPVTGGPANVTVTGGTPPYTYAWTKNLDFNGNTSITNNAIKSPSFGSVGNVTDGNPFTSTWSLQVNDSGSNVVTASTTVYLEYTTLS